MSEAQGRLEHWPPVAVIDIGSNSVRLVVYEGLTRSPTPIFNEKVLCGLGREVHTTGLLPPDAITKALEALKRFRGLCDLMSIKKVFTVATAACRDAKNGAQFVKQAEALLRIKIEILSGKREAELAGLGIVSGMHRPDGVVGDLGGGSLELVDVNPRRVKPRLTLPLGSLALQDLTNHSIGKADKFVTQTLAGLAALKDGAGRDFYAIGGTWRALARLHMRQTGHPLHVTHNYILKTKEALEFSRLVRRVDPSTLSHVEVVSGARRALLPYAALVMEHILENAKPEQVVFSALGMREGLLFSMLDKAEQQRDPLIEAAKDLNVLRSRSPKHCEDLIGWTDHFMASSGLSETKEETRLRHAACLLADIGWRAHPDYRGEQSLNIIVHAAFVGVDHPGRAFLALSVFFRHAGFMDDELSPQLRELASTRMIDRARVLGAAMRVAFLVSAAMPNVLPKTPMAVERGKLTLHLRGDYAPLAGERVFSRLRQLARLIGREPVVDVG